MRRLEQLWKEAVAGELRLALLAGEPGVGKTRLAAELAGRINDLGVTVLAGRCDEDLGVPYQPFVEALRHFVDHVAGRGARRLGWAATEASSSGWYRTAERVPGLPAPLQSDPETERYRLFDAVAAWLAAASKDEPILLVLDDLQWAAGPTLLLLRHLMPGGPIPPGCSSSAPTGTPSCGTTIRWWNSSPTFAARRASSGSRSPGWTSPAWPGSWNSGWVTALADEELPLARAIYQETEGNPFFVREVLRHLAESGTANLPVEELGIPEGVREVVGRRLARLSRRRTRCCGWPPWSGRSSRCLSSRRPSISTRSS